MGIALLVYADTYQHYRYWCEQNDLSPRNPLLQFVGGERSVQGRRQHTPILLVDPAPWWLVGQIATRRLKEVLEVPDPLVEFVPELSDYDYDAGDVADQHYLRKAQVNARQRLAGWSTLSRWAILVLLLFVAAYVGFLFGVARD